MPRSRDRPRCKGFFCLLRPCGGTRQAESEPKLNPAYNQYIGSRIKIFRNLVPCPGRVYYIEALFKDASHQQLTISQYAAAAFNQIPPRFGLSDRKSTRLNSS